MTSLERVALAPLAPPHLPPMCIKVIKLAVIKKIRITSYLGKLEYIKGGVQISYPGSTTDVSLCA